MTLTIGTRAVGPGNPVLVIAEAGVNHNGSVDLAHALVDVAADAGADAVKFQTFEATRLVSATAATTPYQRRATAQERTQAQMLAELQLPESVWRELAAHAHERGILFLSSAFDLPSAELLVELGVPAIKVGSGELTHHRFLRGVAALGVPMLVSTGMADEREVEGGVAACAGAPGLGLFHCVSAYPAPVEDANLTVIPRMAARHRVPVGWSDHTPGSVCAVAAVALGATMLEKHLTTDRGLPGPDHAASLDPDGMAAYVAEVRATEAALGDGVKRRMPSEEENAALVRRGWHAARDLPEGAVLTDDDVVALRPEGELRADELVVGLRLTRAVPAGTPIPRDAVAP